MYNITADELRAFVERFEQLDSEKKDIAEAQKEVISELAGRGYDKKAFRKIIALRKRDAEELAEESVIIEMYAAALGMTV
jgi:uncharacterized protein (UPF0335 family)